jgi:hypothetical protein
LNTLANPNPVHKEIQMISTYVDPRVSEVQKVLITNATGGTFKLSVYGVPTTALSYQASASDVSSALQNAFTTAGYVGTVIAVNMSTLPGNTREYVIDFGEFSEESLELLVLDSLLVNSDAINAADPDHPVPTSVERLRRLNSPISGSFTLSYNGSMSIDMPYDVSAEEMKVCLEDLPGVWYVTVERKEVLFGGDDRVGYQWLVTFDAAAGDLPMLYATPGRLEHLSSGVSIEVTEEQAGSDAVLVYDGTGIPDVRAATIENLVPDMSYSFKVAPLSAIGDGVLSGASTTVISTSGASPAHTTASGSSLSIGITDDVDEQQILTATGCNDATFQLYWGAVSAVAWNNYTAEEFKAVLQDKLMVGDVDVQRTTDVNASLDVTYWRITYFDAGDVDDLGVATHSDSCTVVNNEFLKGNRNQFTIEPKKASGDVLREVATAEGFAGLDLFLTETYTNGEWYRDQGIALYNPVKYEVASVFFPSSNMNNVTLFLLDYLTPESSLEYETLEFSSDSSAYNVQVAVESLPNVDSVEVTKDSDSDGTWFLITFVANLGDVPDMTMLNNNVTIEEV